MKSPAFAAASWNPSLRNGTKEIQSYGDGSTPRDRNTTRDRKKIHKARIRDKNRDEDIAKIRDRDRDTEYLGSSLGLPGQAAGVLETATSLTKMQNPSNIFRVSQECGF